MAKEFDSSRLSADFAKLWKPAQRARVNAGIHSAAELARRSASEMESLHGMGPASMPILRAALKTHGLRFRAAR